MKKEQYKTLSGDTLYRPVLTTKEMQHIMFDGCGGFCLSCGRQTRGVEPDARKASCPSCKEEKLYGMEELLVMGVLKLQG